MQRWISRSRRIDLKEMQIEDQFVKKKNIIQRKIEYEQEISKIFVFWFDLIWLGTTFIKPAVGARPKVTFVKFRLHWWWKWWEEKGQYGDVDLFVDCKEGDSIEWVLPLAVTYIGQEDAERSLCFLTLFQMVISRKNEDDSKIGKIWTVWRYYLYWAGECREHRAFQCCPRSQTCEMCTLSSWKAQNETGHNLWLLQTLWNRAFDQSDLLKESRRQTVVCWISGSDWLFKLAVWGATPGEHVDHRVNPVLLVSIREGHHFNSIGEERPVKKSVEEKHLTLERDMNGW